MPRNYGVSNLAPYAAPPAVGLAGDGYYNTAQKRLFLSDGSVWNPQGYTWRGAWTTGLSYNPYDTVSYQGSSYVCVSANTAAAGNAPGVVPTITPTASSPNPTWSGNTPAMAIDGNTSTYWQCTSLSGSASSGTATITVDLTLVGTLTQVRVQWLSGYYAAAYNIDLSTDNSTWTNVATITGNASADVTSSFASTSARYIRITIPNAAFGAPTNNYCSQVITEITWPGANLGTPWVLMAQAGATGASTAGMYTQVAASAPNASAPAITPPTGFLWVDTSTTFGIATTAYFPPQAPPASGFNTFTDSSGTIWCSYNGSAWQKATTFLCGRVHRTAAWNTAAGAIPFDTLDYGYAGMFNLSNGAWTCPLTGNYHMSVGHSMTGTVPASTVNSDIALVAISRGGTLLATGSNGLCAYNGGGASSQISDIVACTTGDVISIGCYSTPGKALQIGSPDISRNYWAIRLVQ